MDRDRRHTHSVTLPGEQIVTYTPQESAYLESNIGISSGSPNNNSKHVQHQPMFPVGKAVRMVFSVVRVLQRCFKILVSKTIITLCFGLPKSFCSNFRQNFALCIKKTQTIQFFLKNFMKTHLGLTFNLTFIAKQQPKEGRLR